MLIKAVLLLQPLLALFRAAISFIFHGGVESARNFNPLPLSTVGRVPGWSFRPHELLPLTVDFDESQVAAVVSLWIPRDWRLRIWTLRDLGSLDGTDRV